MRLGVVVVVFFVVVGMRFWYECMSESVSVLRWFFLSFGMPPWCVAPPKCYVTALLCCRRYDRYKNKKQRRLQRSTFRSVVRTVQVRE